MAALHQNSYIQRMDGSFTPAVSGPPSATQSQMSDSATLPISHTTRWQQTLGRKVGCTGVGVHSGAPANLSIEPAPVDTGIIFIRTDKPDGQNRIPARYDRVTDTRMCTVLTNEHGVGVGTVEHLMAALAGSHIDNAIIRIDGPEIPIMDGSSAPFVLLLQQAATISQAVRVRSIKVLRPVRVEENGKWASLDVADALSYSMEIEFASQAIGKQAREFTLSATSFADELGRARTFGFLQEVEQMRAMGLGKGGSLDNAIVIDGDKIMNESGLRYGDEFVRHKLLDSVGDLALAGAPIIGAFRSAKGGHALNNKLLRALFADAANWAWV